MASRSVGKARVQRALLICNGDPPSAALARSLAATVDHIVAADGGANRSRALGLIPDVIIGDLDSLTASTRKVFKQATIIRVRRQDNTDMEKALDYLHECRCREVVIVGSSGGRVDFTLSNMLLIWRYVPAMRIVIAGDGWTMFPVTEEAILRVKKKTIVSVIAMDTASGVTLNGLRYPLVNGTLGIQALGLSNEVVANRFSVRVRKGRLLVSVAASASDITVESAW